MKSNRRARWARWSLVIATAAMMAACGGESEAELVASAKAYLQKSDQKSAMVQLKAALQKNPQSAEARYLLGQALLATGDFKLAVVELEKAQDLKHPDDEVLPALARARKGLGEFKKVTDLYSRVTLRDPKAAADLKASVAAAFASQGQLDRSNAAVASALQLDPANMEARLLKARLTAGTGAIDDALAQVAAILADDPKRTEAFIHRGQMLWFAKRDGAGALAAFDAALALDPRAMAAHMALISMALQQSDIPAFKARVAALKKAVPGHPEARFYDAQMALIDRDYPRARELTQQLLKIAPDSARTLQMAGAIELQSGSLVLAETHLNKALQQSPDLAPARRMLAETYLRTGQTDKALATLKPLIDRSRPDSEALSLAAEAYLQAGDAAKAEATFRQAAALDPSNERVKLALALSQVSKGQVNEGLAAMTALAQADKGTVVDLALISVLTRRNDLDGALAAVERLRAKIPGKPLPDQLRGRTLAQKKDLAGARASFEKALAADASYFPAVAALAALDTAENKPADALKRYEAFLVREPKNVRALTAVATLRQRAGAKPQEIIALLGDAVKASPGDAAPHVLLVDYLLSQRDPKAARAAAQAAVTALPDNLQVMDAQARALLAAGDVEQSIVVFRKVAAAQPNVAMPQMNLGEAYLRSKDYAAAAQSLRRALDIQPDLMPAYIGLVQLAMMDKRVDEALAVARAAQKQRPKDPAPFWLELDIHQSQKRWDPAIAAARQALALDRATLRAIRLHGVYLAAGRKGEADRFAAEWERERPKDADFQIHLATQALTRSEFAQSESLFRKALVMRPDDALALNNVAWLMIQQGKPGAVAVAERANTLMPNSTAVMDTLASALAADKQLPKAIEVQRQAVAAAPEAANLRLNLARLLAQNGEKAAARAELDRLAKLGDKFPRQAEVAALLKTLP